MHQLSDKEILQTILTQQKFMAEMYNQAAGHTDDPQLLRTLVQCIGEKQTNRLKTYQAMHARGWYNPQLIEETQLTQAKQKFQQQRQSLQSITQQQSSTWQQPGTSTSTAQTGQWTGAGSQGTGGRQYQQQGQYAGSYGNQGTSPQFTSPSTQSPSYQPRPM